MTKPPDQPALFRDHMADWQNDDLLFTAAQRRLLDAEHPGALAVFDFPGVRALFDGFDRSAAHSRRRRQRAGLLAITIGAIGAAIIPLNEVLGIRRSAALFELSAVLSLGGLVWAAALMLLDRHKVDWLYNRLRTERLRQFYFQFLLRNADAGAAALADPAALPEWHARQSAALAGFRAWLDKPVANQLAAVRADVNDDDVWFFERWRTAPEPTDSAASDTYFAILRRQRMGVQQAYIRQKLAAGWGSPETRLKVVHQVGWITTVLIALLTAGAALSTLDSAGPAGAESVGRLVGAIALIGVAGTYARVLAEGLQVRRDTERYRWYVQAVDAAAAKANDRNHRIAAFEALERASYRELREFVTAHDAARFTFN